MKGLVSNEKRYDGVQKLYRFDNGYGASVIRHFGSYGYEKGLWELAVIHWEDENEWHLCYDTPITDDVIGYLSEKEILIYLDQIEKL